MKKALFAILVASASTLHAADLTWTGAANSNYDDPGNWGGSAPTATDTATFYAPGAGNLSMTVTATSEVGSIFFGDNADSNVTLDIAGKILYLANDINITAGSAGSHSILDSIVSSGSTDSGLLLGLPTDVAGTYTHNILNNSGQTFTIGTNISGSSAPEVNIIRELQIGGSGNIVMTGTFFDSGILVSNGTALAATASSSVISLNKVGTGTLTLGANNQYSGSTRISAGTLEATNLDGFAPGVPSSIGDSTSDSLSTMPKLILSGGTLRYIGTGGTSGRTLMLGTGTSAMVADGSGAISFTTGQQAIKFDGSGPRTLILSGTNTGTNIWRFGLADGPGGVSSLIKDGTGYWKLTSSTNQTFTGTLSLLGGILEFDNPNQLGGAAAPVYINTGTLKLGGVTARALSSTQHPVIIGAGGATAQADAATFTFTTLVSGVGSLTKIGSGTVAMGTSGKTYSGGTIVKEGTLQAISEASLGDVTGAVTFAGGTLGLTSAAATNVTSARNYIVGQGGGVINKTLAGAGVWSITGTLSGTGALTVANAATTVALNADNPYSGNLTVASGTLRLGNGNALQNSTAIVNAENGLTFATAGVTYTLGGLSGTSGFAAASTDSGAIALQVGNNNSSNTYSGTLSGLGSLIKVGTGTQTLSGVNTYSGSTAITGGTLLITGDINSASAISVGSGGKISTGFGAILENEVTVDSGGRIGGNGIYTDATGITLGSGAIAAPGNSAGDTIYQTDLSFQNGAIYEWELTAYDENPGVTSDLITISGAGNLLTFEDGSLISLNFIGIVDPDGVDNFWFEDHSWKIVDAFDGGTYLDLGLDIQGGGAYANGAFSIGTDGQDVYLNYAAIPEPSTMVLMGLGLTSLFFLRRRKAGSQV